MRLASEGKLRKLDPMPFGELTLQDKRVPLCNLPDGPERAAIPLATSRGTVEIAPLLALLAESPDDVWLPEGQQSNVNMQRAGHDRWGVGKIVLVFCDDFFTQVFHMPWWHRPEKSWRAAVMPILTSLGVPENRLIRCLLAAMPPGQHIPTHHDTGVWVPRCHRIHVPLVTDPSKVFFSVGYTEDEMQAVPIGAPT